MTIPQTPHFISKAQQPGDSTDKSSAAEVEITHVLGRRHYYERKELRGAVPDADGRIEVAFGPRFTMPGVSEVWGRAVNAEGMLLWADR